MQVSKIRRKSTNYQNQTQLSYRFALVSGRKKNYIISNNYTDQRHIQVDGIIYGCLISVRGTTIISNVTLYKKGE